MNVYSHYLKSAAQEAAKRLEKVYQIIKGDGKDINKGRFKDLSFYFYFGIIYSF